MILAHDHDLLQRWNTRGSLLLMESVKYKPSTVTYLYIVTHNHNPGGLAATVTNSEKSPKRKVTYI